MSPFDITTPKAALLPASPYAQCSPLPSSFFLPGSHLPSELGHCWAAGSDKGGHKASELRPQCPKGIPGAAGWVMWFASSVLWATLAPEAALCRRHHLGSRLPICARAWPARVLAGRGERSHGICLPVPCPPPCHRPACSPGRGCGSPKAPALLGGCSPRPQFCQHHFNPFGTSSTLNGSLNSNYALKMAMSLNSLQWSPFEGVTCLLLGP